MVRPCFDAIVVGAGPAGCAAAYDLCADGRSVLLVDRRDFPRLKVCAGGLTVKSLNLLRFNVQPVIRRECKEMAIGHRWAEPVVGTSGTRVVAMTERVEFDDYCLQQTRARGASFRVIRAIEGVFEREDRVELIVDGEIICGKFLIGADGAKSQIRRLIGEGSTWFRRGLGIEIAIPWSVDQSQKMQFDLGVVNRGYGWIFPKDDHLNVGLYSSLNSKEINKKTLAKYVKNRLGDGPADGISYGGALGLGGEHYKPQARRVFLVGDAAGLVEPLMGEGIFNAIKSGQCAAQAIEAEIQGVARAQEKFASLLSSIQDDINYCARWEKRLYRHFDFWCGLLTTRPVRTALLEGYARGRTFSEIRNAWLSLLAGYIFRPLQ